MGQNTSGKDFFAWWDAGFGATYYLGRALTQMWSDVRWRLPANDKEEQTLADVSHCLQRAYALDPSLEYPWAEWAEILDFSGDTDRHLNFVHSHVTKKSSIGYRRRNVRALLPGSWSIEIPGSFSDFALDGEADFVSVDPPREIWFSAFRKSSQRPLKEFQEAKKDLRGEKSQLFEERDQYATSANVTTKLQPDGTNYFIQQSTHIVPGRRALCTIVFHDPIDQNLAEEIWKSMQVPSQPLD